MTRKTYGLTSSPLYRLRSRSKLARLLRVSNAELRALAAGDSLYREFDIQKKGGGSRHVENPSRPLKLVQARLARLLARITPPDYLYCPAKGRCYVTNAAQHAGNRVVRTLDIQKFFPSTSSKRVFWFFHKVLCCARDIAGLLTVLTTYQRHLPTGSPLSPIMSHFANMDLWEEISEYCRGRSLTFTVYVDDCTLSGDRISARDLWDIKQMIHRRGLVYHKEKAYFGGIAEVTGVIIRDGKLAAPNRQMLKLRQTTSRLQDAAPSDALALQQQVAGLKGQLRQITHASLT